ncbi:hypothetical protein A9Q84_21340 [Halobacteriovorax marinus]|uniref:BatD n=1 Tax=Halobacteriovorax marinus TaxID=97084 RepID=A0A1Y5F7G0_9BACT|nr:hypothetical protein A9Q84_21340 [Halobacteriovorax marinus]
MKKILFALLLLSCFNTFSSDKVKVLIQPSRPIVNEPFDLIFKIKLTGNEEPYISFDPGNAQVTGRSNRGVSVKTTIINGKFTTTKEVTYVYNIISERSGRLLIKNVEVDFGNGKKEKIKNLKINVLREAKRPKDIFILAIPSKTDVFVGEGFDVNYYLYFRVGVLGNEVEKYPPLGKFLKRFHMVNEVVETVRYQGEIYRRSLKYSARLFAQKAGEATIDPIKLKVQYSPNRNRGAFGFGIQLGQYRTRSFQSKKVKINVMSLPTENIPPYFSGLVGKHEYTLTVPRNKYVVNEAVEAKLEVKGVGALEALDPPVVFSHPNLEEFDTKGELQAINQQIHKKTFEYTYLARSSFVINEKNLKVAYFDPDTREYVTTEIQVPKLIISGSSVTSKSYTRPSKDTSIEVLDQESNLEAEKIGLVGINLGKSETRSITPFKFNLCLGFVILLILGSFFIRKSEDSGIKSEINKLVKLNISKNGTFSSLYGLLNMIPGEDSLNPREKLEQSKLSSSSKKYFSLLLDSLERGTYSNESKNKVDIHKKHFSELRKYLYS